MPDRARKASSEQSYNKVKRKMKLRIKKNPFARVAFRIFVLCLCLLASTAHATAQEVVYERVTNASQLVAGEKYIFVDVKNKTVMSWYNNKENRKGAKLNDSNLDGDSIVKNISSIKLATVYEFVLYQNKGETTWGFYDSSVHKKFLCARKDGENGIEFASMTKKKSLLFQLLRKRPLHSQILYLGRQKSSLTKTVVIQPNSSSILLSMAHILGAIVIIILIRW